MPSSSDIRPEALGRWLGDRLGAGAPLRIDGLETPKAGFSNETIFFRATPAGARRAGDRYVLRRAGAGVAIYPVQSDAVNVSSVELQQCGVMQAHWPQAGSYAGRSHWVVAGEPSADATRRGPSS